MGLLEQLEAYAKEGYYPFHMPGHKGGRLGGFGTVFPLDITEISGFDNLHEPEGILKTAQEEMAKVYGVRQSFFLVNGSTSGLVASLLTLLNPGDEVLVARNCHRSVWAGILLSGAKPVFVFPEPIKELGVYGAVAVEAVAQALKEHPKVKGIVLTSPTYEGIVSPIKGISTLAKKMGLFLLVDEAHGAHFLFSEKLPPSAITQGADLVVHSLHKTLPSLTQTAVLHVVSEKIDLRRLQTSLAMVQSSSPSYLFMASIDACRAWLQSQGRGVFSEYCTEIEKWRKEIAELGYISLLSLDSIKEGETIPFDKSRIVFTWKEAVSGYDVGKWLFEKKKIELELLGKRHAIALSSPADLGEGLFRLKEALFALDGAFETLPRQELLEREFLQFLPKTRITPRDAFFMEKEKIPLEQAKGRIAGDFIIPYPPGIPLLLPGEEITEEILKEITLLLSTNWSVLGLSEEHIFVCKGGE